MRGGENDQKVVHRQEVSKRYWENGAERPARCRVDTDLDLVENAVSAASNNGGVPVHLSEMFPKAQQGLPTPRTLLPQSPENWPRLDAPGSPFTPECQHLSGFYVREALP